MKKSIRRAVLLMVLASLASGGASRVVAVEGSWTAKVDPWVLSTAGEEEKTEFLVFLKEQASVHAAGYMTSKEAKGEYVFRTLTDVAARTQGPVLDALKELGVEARPYWIANMIWVRGSRSAVQAMAERPDVLRVSANPSVRIKTLPKEPRSEFDAPSAIEWGITKTGAPNVWSLGFKGSGVVIAGQDTGYQWDHPALKSKYRGWSGSSANHNYNWHDAIHSGGGVCGANSQVPCDDDEHGTHTMGTMVGDDGAGNQIGMAPQAKWIGCRNMNQGNGTPASYSECFQWFVAPTNLAGQNPDPTKAPHVINNSWGCPVSEGCTDPLVLKTVVDNTRAAGIVVVVSAGNAGSSCSTVNDPPAIYDSSFSVGSTDSSDSISSFSSRGPVTLDGSGRMKPDVSAPGSSIRSSVPGSGYGTMSGTSMAGPHVAGHVALLLSAMPGWKGQVGLVEDRIMQSAVPRTSAQTCGGIPGTQIPNNTFGWGRIDALASVSMVDVAIQITDTPDPVAEGSQLTYRVFASNTGIVTATNVVATVILSPQVTFVSTTPGCTHNAGTVTCSFGSIVKGTFPEHSIVTTVNGGGSFTTSGSITGSLYDYNTGNNQVFVTTTAGSTSDVWLTKTGAFTPALAGAPFTYTLTAGNLGPAAAGAVTLTDTLPSNSVFASASSGCSHSSGTVTCALGTVNSGTSSMINITVTAPASGSMTNSATVTGGVGDSNLGNNSASVTTPVVAAQPVNLDVDTHASSGAGSNLNGVFEPGEQVVLNPSWQNPSGGPATLSATASAFGGPAGPTYTLADAAASYGTVAAGVTGNCWDALGNCFEAALSVPAARPARHWDATVTETLSTGTSKTWTLHMGDSFADVPRTHWAYKFVETILHNNVTAGCSATDYCPELPLTRAEMAVLLLAAKHGKGWTPAPSTGNVFLDVPVDFWAGDFIEALHAEGVTSGCGGGNYCPNNPITRAEMSVFLLMGEHGAGWVPPLSTGTVFNDVPIDHWAGDFIEALAAEGITGGCGGGNYCPNSPVTRAQMAVFLTATFGLKLY